MSCGADQWARDWLAERRAEGETGLTVEKRGNTHIVRWATTVWDKEQKKYHKVSEYRGTLQRDGTLVPPRKRRDTGAAEARTVLDEGSAKVLKWATDPIFRHLKEAFPADYREITALSWTRCLGRGALNKAGRCWNRLQDVYGLRPNTSPKSLSGTLERVGAAGDSQNRFFELCRDAEDSMAVDLSVIFSRSRGCLMARKGYNRFKLSCPQFNLLMCCGMKSGRPQYMKVLAGNTKEDTAVTMLDSFDIEPGTLLVMDRGYSNSKLLEKIGEKGLGYLVPVKRNSKLYAEDIPWEGMFRWNESAVRYSKSETADGAHAYRFLNLEHQNEELVDGLWAQEHGKDRGPNDAKAGCLILISSEDLRPEDAYGTYKARVSIEDGFDTAKTVLDTDRMYMHDDQHVMGFLFVTFVSMLIRFRISCLLELNELSSRFTPEDVLDVYGCMKTISADREIRQIVPKDVRELDARLGLFFYSTEADRERILKEDGKLRERIEANRKKARMKAAGLV